MQVFEKLLRTTFAFVTAFLMWQIYVGNEPWFQSLFAGQPGFVVPGALLAMLIVEIVVVWPLLRSTSER